MIFTLCPHVNGKGYSGVYGNWKDMGNTPIVFDNDRSQSFQPVILQDDQVPRLPVSEEYTNTFSLPAPTSDMETIEYYKFRMYPGHGTLLSMYAVYVDLTTGRISREEWLGNVCAIGTYANSSDMPSPWAGNDISSFELFVPVSASDMGKSIMVFSPIIGITSSGAQAKSCWIEPHSDLTVSVIWSLRNPDNPNMVVRKTPFRVMLPTGYDSTTVDEMDGRIETNRNAIEDQAASVAQSISQVEKKADDAEQAAIKANQTAESTFNTIQSRFAVR